MATDLFDEVFNSFKNFESDQQPHNNRIRLLNKKLLFQENSVRLERLNILRKLNSNKLNSVSRQFETTFQHIEYTKNKSLLIGASSKLTVLKRLYQQRKDADKRTRDLIYEISGEYGKTSSRLHKRKLYLEHAHVINHMYALWMLRWNRFCAKLVYELSTNHMGKLTTHSVSSVVLCPCIHSEEVQDVLGQLTDIHDVSINALPTGGTHTQRDMCSDIDCDCVDNCASFDYVSVGAIIRISFHKPNKWGNIGGKECRNFLENIQYDDVRSKKESSFIMGNDKSSLLKIAAVLQHFHNNHCLTNVEVSRHTHGESRGRRRSQSHRIETEMDVECAQSIPLTLVSNQCIYWMHLPSINDSQIFSEVSHFCPAFESNTYMNLNSSLNLNAFAGNASLKHTSFTSSDHVYFCLEERQNLLRLENESEFADPPDNKQSLNTAMMLVITKLLQDIYVDPRDASAIPLEDMRTAMRTDTLVIDKMLDTHHKYDKEAVYRLLKASRDADSSSVMNDQKLSDVLSSALMHLSIYPSVLKAKMSSGGVLHFACASLEQLKEISCSGKSLVVGSDMEMPPSTGAKKGRFDYSLFSVSRFEGKSMGATDKDTEGDTNTPSYSVAKSGISFMSKVPSFGLDLLLNHYNILSHGNIIQEIPMASVSACAEPDSGVSTTSSSTKGNSTPRNHGNSKAAGQQERKPPVHREREKEKIDTDRTDRQKLINEINTTLITPSASTCMRVLPDTLLSHAFPDEGEDKEGTEDICGANRCSDYALIQLHQQSGDNVNFYLVQLFKTDAVDAGSEELNVLRTVLGYHTGSDQSAGGEKYCLAMGIADSPCFEMAAAAETAAILNDNAYSFLKASKRFNLSAFNNINSTSILSIIRAHSMTSEATVSSTTTPGSPGAAPAIVNVSSSVASTGMKSAFSGSASNSSSNTVSSNTNSNSISTPISNGFEMKTSDLLCVIQFSGALNAFYNGNRVGSSSRGGIGLMHSYLNNPSFTVALNTIMRLYSAQQELLLQSIENRMESNSVKRNESYTHVDNNTAMLSTLCKWRTCMCESIDSQPRWNGQKTPSEDLIVLSGLCMSNTEVLEQLKDIGKRQNKQQSIAPERLDGAHKKKVDPEGKKQKQNFQLCRYHNEVKRFLEYRDMGEMGLMMSLGAVVSDASQQEDGENATLSLIQQLQRMAQSLNLITNINQQNNQLIFSITNSNSAHVELSKYIPRRSQKFPHSSLLSVKNYQNKLILTKNQQFHRDYMIISRASTLLQELCNKKLETTLSNFVKKLVSMEMKVRNRLELIVHCISNASTLTENTTVKSNKKSKNNMIASSSPSKNSLKSGNSSIATSKQSSVTIPNTIPVPTSMPPNAKGTDRVLDMTSVCNYVMYNKAKYLLLLLNAPIVWSKWKNPSEFDHHLERIEREYMLLYEILNIDKECSSEINLLSELGIYPSAELALIRKDIKSLHEKQALVDEECSEHLNKKKQLQYEQLLLDTLQMELRVMEKKLDVLRSKRMDEADARLMYEKKLARARQREEMQAKDPMNFHNQRF